MKMALLGNTLLIKDASDDQRTAIESWNRMEWNTETQIFSGPADLELLSRLARMVRLPPAVAGYRDRLWNEQNAAKRTDTKLPELPFAWPGKLTLRGNVLQVSGLDSEQFHIIKSWRRLKWDGKTQSFRGIVGLELLDRLAEMGRLPAGIADYRSRLRTVTMPLYAHQMRGANMALLTFGWAEPQEARHE